MPMRGANAVRRRSVTNPGQAGTGAVNGGQADGGGSGLLSGGGSVGEGSGASGAARQGTSAAIPAERLCTDKPGCPGAICMTCPKAGLGQIAAAQGLKGGSLTTTSPESAPSQP